jgi:hypothetical protein
LMLTSLSTLWLGWSWLARDPLVDRESQRKLNWIRPTLYLCWRYSKVAFLLDMASTKLWKEGLQ